MEYKKEEILAGKDKFKKEMRDNFVIEYANKQGWDFNELNTDQLKEIKSQQGYKNPKMICS